MSMPKTAMDEYRFLFAWENNVGTARQSSSVQSIAAAHAIEQPPYNKFWTCVLCANRLHNASALFTSSRIHI
jgi:hypothetical protein